MEELWREGGNEGGRREGEVDGEEKELERRKCFFSLSLSLGSHCHAITIRRNFRPESFLKEKDIHCVRGK